MKRKFSYKAVLLSLLALLICLSAVVLSVAYLKQQTGAVTNTFLRGEDPKQTYWLDYNLNGGESDTIKSETVEATEEEHIFTVTSEEPSRLGYQFLGWADTADAKVPTCRGGSTVTVTKDDRGKTLYAVWQEVDDFVLYFQYNLPDSVKNVMLRNMPETMTAKYAGSGQHTFTVTNVPYDENADATGLTFLGWTTVEGGTVIYPADDTIDVIVTQKVTTLYAVWGFEYFVAFDRNPGDGTVGKYSRENGTLVNVNSEDKIILGSDSQTVSPYLLYESGEYSYAREKYMLVGFSYEADGATPEEYVTVAKPGRNNAETVYAIWVQGDYALIYDANGGSNAPATQTEKEGKENHTFDISTKIPTKMEGSNGVFKGWAYTADAEEPVFAWNEGSETFDPPTVTLDINDPVRVLYAVWEYTYTLTYQLGSLADADSPMPENQTVKSSKPTCTFTIPKEPVPTRDTEYLFHYWAEGEERINGEFRYCDNNGFYFDQAVVTAAEPGIELYPRFRPAEGYKVVFKRLKDANGNNDTTDVISLTTQTICTYEIPPWADYKVSSGDNNITFLGWSEKDDPYSIEPDYVIGDVVRINPDTDTHTKTLYPVYREWDYFSINLDYDGGTGTKNLGCDKTESVDSYESKYIHFIEPGQSQRVLSSFKASDVFLPSKSGYELKGFNYRKNGTEASFNMDNIDKGGCNDDGSSIITIYDVVFDLDKAAAGEQTITKSTTKLTHGATRYTLTLYAVWAKKDAYDKYQLILDSNTNSVGNRYFEEELLQSNAAYAVTFQTTTKDVSISRAGYKLTGFAYDPEGNEPCAAYVDGHLDKDIIVSQSDTAHVKRTDKGGRDDGDLFTLRLYAMWEPQQVFYLKLDYNGGDRYESSSNPRVLYEEKKIVRPPEETAYTWDASTEYKFFSRYGYVFKGFAYSKDATEPDFLMSGYKFPEGMTVDKNDTDHVVNGTIYGVPSTELTLYAVWEPQQIFELRQDFTGGVYTFSDKSTTTIWTKSAVVPRGQDSYTFSRTSPNIPTRSGYRLLGYAYTKEATSPDFIWDGKQGFDPTITVSKLDTEHEIKLYTSSDGVEVTQLTVYAVWEKEKRFTLNLDPNGGSTVSNESKTVELSVTQATWEAGTTIAAPTLTGFKLLGYATSKDATVPDYPVRDIYYDSSSKTNRAYLTEDIIFTDEQEGVDHDRESAPETHTLTLYAVWEPMRRFAVTINQNVGTSPSDYTTYSSYYDKSVTSATIAVSSSTNGALSSYPGYNLKGAAYKPDAKKVNFVGNSFSVVVDTADTEHVTVTTEDNGVETVTLRLYAIWSVKLSYAGRGSDLPDTVEVINPTAEERVVSIAQKQPTYQNFCFAGWTTNSDALVPEYGAEGYYTKTLKEVSPTVTLEKNTTLYAVWMQKYTLGFDANGGDKNSTPNVEVTYVALGTTSTRCTFAISPNKPYREGYTFLGWATKPDATEATYQPGGTILVNGNTDGSETITTLYAVWQEDTGETTADETTETDGPLLAPSAPETADGGTEGLRLDTEALVGLRVAEAEHRSVWQRGEDMELTLVAKEGYALPQSMLVTVQEEQYVLPQREGEKLPDKLTYDAASGKLTVPAELLQETDTVILAAHADTAVPAAQDSLLRTEQTANGEDPSAPTDGASEVAPAEALPEVAPTEEAPEAAPTENLSEVAPVEAPPEVTLPEASPEEPPQPSETVEAAAAEPAPPLENCGSPAPPGEAETLE